MRAVLLAAWAWPQGSSAGAFAPPKWSRATGRAEPYQPAPVHPKQYRRANPSPVRYVSPSLLPAQLRKVDLVRVRKVQPSPSSGHLVFPAPGDDEDGLGDGHPLVLVEVEAKSFLHHQVRNMVGTLRDVGRHRLAPADVMAIVEARDRRAASAMAPAHGLYLTGVMY